jgi:hypothetical protein
MARSAGRWRGTDYVLEHIDEYADRAVKRWRSSGINKELARQLIRKELSKQTAGRKGCYDHPSVCMRRESAQATTWRELALSFRPGDPSPAGLAESLRLSHHAWHKQNKIPACGIDRSVAKPRKEQS